MLTPAIVQDADTGRVLMLGYMNDEALDATRTSGFVTFYSRSKQRLWRKGETSGNTLTLVDIREDCDHDTYLVRARPAGPTCHNGTVSCFGDAVPGGFLHTLEETITARAEAGDGSTSYTAKLLGDGVARVAQKLGEEGVETALAAVAGDDDAVLAESADLLYHLLVLLRARGITLDALLRTLAARQA
ncbi:MAG: bifunctional phosphoribosyl-AMP cyclohydrolase/phosphoribosyl-ATP diphosphatase HisIE [Xanthomonadaceae bacterium]|nr:bifunctional phosphoribosyl-AMP cyclohydrolase/phosphoribosyl-ATP diphosphatase HisIE [Xanthomonadaceae bacterium]